MTAVSIVEPEGREGISPLILGAAKAVPDDFCLDRPAHKQRRAKSTPKLRGRHSVDPLSGKSPRLSAQQRFTESPRLMGQNHVVASPSELPEALASQHQLLRSERGRHHRASVHELHAHISAWLASEKERRRKKRDKAHLRPSDILAKLTKRETHQKESDGTPDDKVFEDEERDAASRRSSDAAIDDLAQILEHFLPSNSGKKTSRVLDRRSSLRKLRRISTTTSSDGEYYNGELMVPSCDVFLDNTKTISSAGDAAEPGGSTPGSLRNYKEGEKENVAWSTFKLDIVRLTHTLGLKGWRRVAMERADEIHIKRLTNALTNAVYVVTPPANLPPRTPGASSVNVDKLDKAGEVTLSSRVLGTSGGGYPKKLLLRIYGPQVEHLIDRKSELAILNRLVAKNIGPKLLATFTNGRFEEYINSTTLTSADVHDPEKSKQIARRMRELHDGIDLLPSERRAGPMVFQNWDKWVERCSVVVPFVDHHDHCQVVRRGSKVPFGHICGTEWELFQKVYEKYRKWLIEEQYGGMDKLRDKLIFAHNDAQYGNILRKVPTPTQKSPLLHDENSHKSLIVIDFEYANANARGSEFANHFTEWCYNYDEAPSYACDTAAYPTVEEQSRFIRAYVQHRPDDDGANAGPEPATGAGANGADGQLAAEKEEREQEALVQSLLKETKLWRMAHSAQWVAWGIVQAKVAGLPAKAVDGDGGDAGGDDASAQAQGAEAGDEDHFDYLAYSHDRALFFWGDAVALGFVEIGELPASLRPHIKTVDY